jgi:hypothetical protein
MGPPLRLRDLALAEFRYMTETTEPTGFGI